MFPEAIRKLSQFNSRPAQLTTTNNGSLGMTRFIDILGGTRKSHTGLFPKLPELFVICVSVLTGRAMAHGEGDGFVEKE